MKFFLFFMLMFPTILPAQEKTIYSQTPSTVKERYREDEVPPKGIKAVPQLQEDNSIENPFKIGPYKDGKYQYTNPDREPDENNSL